MSAGVPPGRRVRDDFPRFGPTQYAFRGLLPGTARRDLRAHHSRFAGSIQQSFQDAPAKKRLVIELFGFQRRDENIANLFETWFLWAYPAGLLPADSKYQSLALTCVGTSGR